MEKSPSTPISRENARQWRVTDRGICESMIAVDSSYISRPNHAPSGLFAPGFLWSVMPPELTSEALRIYTSEWFRPHLRKMP
jgi:hypothetical protein